MRKTLISLLCLLNFVNTYAQPEPRIESGWITLCKYVEEYGKFIGVQPIGDTPKKFDKDYTLPYGAGAYLLAASEVYRML